MKTKILFNAILMATTLFNGGAKTSIDLIVDDPTELA